MNYRHPAGRLFWEVLFALLCVILTTVLAFAQETVVKEAPPLAPATPSTSPAATGMAPAGQEPPNLEVVQSEPLPTQVESTKPDASSSIGNQHTFELFGPPPDGQTPVRTITINRGDHTIGNWHIRPTLSTAVTYDDNIFISNTAPQSDLSMTISPGIAAGFGDFRRELLSAAPYEHPFQFIPDDLDRRDYFFARYAAHDNLFVHHSSLDAVDQDGLLDTQFELSKLTLRLKAAIQTLSNADIQLGTRVRRTIESAELLSKYPLSEKTSLEAAFAVTSNAYQGVALNATEFSNQDSFNFAISPKIVGTIGARFSYLEVQQNPAQVAEQLLFRAVYQAGAKLAIDATAGGEFRQVIGGQSLTDGVFRLACTYQPFDGSTLALTASRFTGSSADLGGQDETVTGVDAEIRQRLFRKFYLILAAGYNNNVYKQIVTLAAQREDNYAYVRPRIMFDVTRWASLQFSFEIKSNQSTSSFGFIDHMAMVQCDIVF